MGNMFRSMGDGGAPGGLEDIIKLFSPASGFMSSADNAQTDDVQKLMDSVADRHSHMQKPTLTRIIITVKKQPKFRVIKLASEEEVKPNEQAKKIVQAYGAYKLAEVKAMKDMFGSNYIDEAKSLALVYHNNV